MSLSVDAFDALWRRPDDLAVTGAGCCLGIIDQPTIMHPGFADNITTYQVIRDAVFNPTMGHGTATASVAVGEIGVAPQAQAVYCAIEPWKGRFNFLENHAAALRFLKDYVVGGGALDAITTSFGWKKGEDGAKPNNELVAWFQKRHTPIFAPHSVTHAIAFRISPTGYAPHLYEPSAAKAAKDKVGVPSDGRLLAACPGRQNMENGALYYRDRQGGDSWVEPYVAGAFLLLRQAQPKATHQAFVERFRRSAVRVAFRADLSLPVFDLEAFAGDLVPVRGMPVTDVAPGAAATAYGPT